MIHHDNTPAQRMSELSYMTFEGQIYHSLLTGLIWFFLITFKLKEHLKTTQLQSFDEAKKQVVTWYETHPAEFNKEGILKTPLAKT